MSFREQADKAAHAVAEAYGTKTTPEQAKAVADVIERAIIESYRDAAAHCAEVASKCCAEDRALANKVAEQIERANTALIANLSSLR